MKVFTLMLAIGLFTLPALAEENCTPEKKKAVCTDASIKEQVEWACGLLEKSGKEALPEISAMRYDCCGEPNYVWINDTKAVLVMHPYRPGDVGKDMSGEKDANGKHYYKEFLTATEKTPGGAWVEYMKPQFKDKKAQPKKSLLKRCKVAATGDTWIVGSGSWK